MGKRFHQEPCNNRLYRACIKRERWLDNGMDMRTDLVAAEGRGLSTELELEYLMAIAVARLQGGGGAMHRLKEGRAATCMDYGRRRGVGTGR
jgi:hypothetical protein